MFPWAQTSAKPCDTSFDESAAAGRLRPRFHGGDATTRSGHVTPEHGEIVGQSPNPLNAVHTLKQPTQGRGLIGSQCRAGVEAGMDGQYRGLSPAHFQDQVEFLLQDRARCEPSVGVEKVRMRCDQAFEAGQIDGAMTLGDRGFEDILSGNHGTTLEDMGRRIVQGDRFSTCGRRVPCLGRIPQLPERLPIHRGEFAQLPSPQFGGGDSCELSGPASMNRERHLVLGPRQQRLTWKEIADRLRTDRGLRGTSRIHLNPQSKGNLGKSFETEFRTAWLDHLGVSWTGSDLDDRHQTFAARHPDQVRSYHLGGDQESKTSLLSLFRRVLRTPSPVHVIDTRAQADALIVAALEELQILEICEEAGVRLVFFLFHNLADLLLPPALVPALATKQAAPATPRRHPELNFGE